MIFEAMRLHQWKGVYTEVKSELCQLDPRRFCILHIDTGQ
jgi:hypothetical protein